MALHYAQQLLRDGYSTFCENDYRLKQALNCNCYLSGPKNFYHQNSSGGAMTSSAVNMFFTALPITNEIQHYCICDLVGESVYATVSHIICLQRRIPLSQPDFTDINAFDPCGTKTPWSRVKWSEDQTQLNTHRKVIQNAHHIIVGNAVHFHNVRMVIHLHYSSLLPQCVTRFHTHFS